MEVGDSATHLGSPHGLRFSQFTGFGLGSGFDFELCVPQPVTRRPTLDFLLCVFKLGLGTIQFRQGLVGLVSGTSSCRRTAFRVLPIACAEQYSCPLADGLRTGRECSFGSFAALDVSIEPFG
ncbi:hypothetical protein BS329_11255 [Amycolatopsis coloradensis]|uniref:Uncharacterized protein n=1 Tax=Amycolatopsis coloradensis TaxID=76021 RepID=A0A1R0KWI7_9PSEU|nr:hypothetical protein BS329_11255 [Amycolatopsis coloradensis]